MFYENNFSEENYQLDIGGQQKDIYMISFWLNDRACFRVFANGEENLFSWDEPSGTLQQMDGKEAVHTDLHDALSEKIAQSIALPAITK